MLLGTGATAINGIVAEDGQGGLWKRLEGTVPQAGWTGPECPNETYKTPATGHCTPFCLFKLDSDPNEHRERRPILTASHPG